MSVKHQHWIFPSVHISKRLILSAILAATASSLSPAALATDSKTDYDFYGFIQLDAIYDFNRMDTDWRDSLRPSHICSGQPDCGSDGETVLSVRQTRFGLNTVTQSDIGEIKAKLEFELYGVGSDEGKR